MVTAASMLTNVEDGLRGIEPKAVEVKPVDPVAGVARVEPRRRRSPPIEFRRSPVGLVAIGEVV
jgi:hypothetical protein